MLIRLSPSASQLQKLRAVSHRINVCLIGKATGCYWIQEAGVWREELMEVRNGWQRDEVRHCQLVASELLIPRPRFRSLRRIVARHPTCHATACFNIEQRARLEIQGSRLETRLRSMDFSGRENPEHKSSGRDIKLGVPSLRFQAR